MAAIDIASLLEETVPIIIVPKRRGRPTSGATAGAASSGVVGGGSPSPSDARVANAIAARWRDASGRDFVPVARITYIMGQRCRECNELTEYVSTPLIRYENKKTGYAHEIPTEVLDTLPHETVTVEPHEVAQCACCLRLSRYAEDAECLDDGGEQLSLFDRAEVVVL